MTITIRETGEARTLSIVDREEARMNERTSIKNQLAASQTEADKRNLEAAAARDPQEHRPEKNPGRTAI